MFVYEIKYNGEAFVASSEPVEMYSTPLSYEITFAGTKEQAEAIATKKTKRLAKSVEQYSKNTSLILMSKCKKCGNFYRISSKREALLLEKKCYSCTFVKKHGVFFNRFDMV